MPPNKSKDRSTRSEETRPGELEANPPQGAVEIPEKLMILERLLGDECSPGEAWEGLQDKLLADGTIRQKPRCNNMSKLVRDRRELIEQNPDRLVRLGQYLKRLDERKARRR